MTPVLRVDGLSKRFGALEATAGVSLDLRPGEIHALIGPNGAGKSTLIAQIAGTLAPDTGSIHLEDRDVTRLGAAARVRAGLTRTFQVSTLPMDLTVRQTAMLGVLGRDGRAFRLWRAARHDRALVDRADAALARVGLDRTGRRTADLSHGERRRLEVAVALTLAPRAFVMDEPMAGLGADGSRQMTGLLDGLRAEAPILLVEHDMDAVFALADRISVLAGGRLLATGTAAEIRADPDVRRAYLGDAA